jgi:hypothetical protein
MMAWSTYSEGLTIPNASGDKVRLTQSPPTGAAHSKVLSMNVAATWSTSSRCELWKSAKSLACGGGVVSVAAGSSDGEDVGSKIEAVWAGREARVNRLWYISCERVLSRNIWIANAWDCRISTMFTEWWGSRGYSPSFYLPSLFICQIYI